MYALDLFEVGLIVMETFLAISAVEKHFLPDCYGG